MVKLQAHRGVSSEFPENTMSAFRASVEQGYDLIEFDPKYTKDGKIVILHDHTVNRTGRREDGTALCEPVRIYDITFEEAISLEYGSWFSSKFKGEKLPLLTELLDLAKETGIPLKVDNVWENFPEEIKEEMFCQIESYGEQINIGFTCARLDTMKVVAQRFPYADIHYDGGDLSRERLDEVSSIAQGHHLYIWVCFDNDMTKWFTGSKATKELCDFVSQYAETGIWILSKREELDPAIREFDASVIETTGHIKPEWVKNFS